MDSHAREKLESVQGYYVLMHRFSVALRPVLVLYSNLFPIHVLYLFFPSIFYLKSKRNIPRIFKKQFFFNRHKYPSSLNAPNINYFGTLSPNHKRIQLSLNHLKH